MIQKTRPSALQSSAYFQLATVEDILRRILNGEKPYLNPNEANTGWLYDQVARMHAGFLVPDEARCYFTLPTETPGDVRLKGDTRFHAAGYPLVKSAQTLRDDLKDKGMNNHRILGFLPQFRDIYTDPREMLKGQGAVVMAKGDVYTLWQMVALLKDRVELGKSQVPIIINNHRDLWLPFLDFCDRLKVNFQALNVRRADTFEAVTRTMARHAENMQRNPRHTIEPMAGSRPTILVQTSNDKKIHELKSILKFHGVDALVLPYALLVDRPEEPREESGTYTGNNDEKRVKADEKTDSLPREEIEERLRAYGADPDQTLVLMDDRGLDTNLDLYGTEEFERCEQYLNPYRQTPGPELANVLKSMSLGDFYANLKSVADRTDFVDLSAHDITAYVLTDLFPRANGKRRTRISFGATLDEIGFEARPAHDKHKYSEHYLKPAGDPRGRTKAEIPHYIESKSSQARAALGMIGLAGFDKGQRMDLTAQANKNFRHAGYSWGHRKVLTHTGFFPHAHGHGDKYIFKRLREGFNIASGRGGAYDYTRTRAHTVKKDGKEQIVHSGLANFQRYVEDGDAFLFGPFPPQMQQGAEELRIHQIFQFMSMTVGKQVFDPAVHSKLWAVFSNHWDVPLAIMEDFHDMGFIGQKPEHLFTHITDRNKRGIINEVGAKLDEHFRSYHPLKYTEPKYMEKGKEVEGLFRVTVYCSATSTNKDLRKETFDLSYRLAAHGMAVKYGAGTEGMMRQVNDGFYALREDAKKMQKQPINCIIGDQYEYTRRAEGLADWNDKVRVHPNIYSRIEKLQETDAEIVLAGGAGTIQEIVASMITRLNGTRPVENRPMVIVNQQVGRKGAERGVYDKFLTYFSDTMLKRCNIHVVDNIEQAMAIVLQARKDMGLKPRYVSLANDVTRYPAPATFENRA